jgi:hypothetical protein
MTAARPLAGRWTLAILIPLTVAACVAVGLVAVPQYEKAHGSDYRQTTPAPAGDAGSGKQYPEATP